MTGIVLVSGTTTKQSRDAMPRPAQQTAVLCIEGTGDPAMPYGGGPIGGRALIGMMTAHRAKRHGATGDGRVVVAAGTVARDWAAANGAPPEPSVDSAPMEGTDLPVTMLTWASPECPQVVLYRIEGGGHGWPGGPQQMPARLIGPISSDLDTTGILLEMARRQVESGAPPRA